MKISFRYSFINQIKNLRETPRLCRMDLALFLQNDKITQKLNTKLSNNKLDTKIQIDKNVF